MSAGRPSGPEIDISIASDLWAAAPDAEKTVRRAIAAFADGLNLDNTGKEISVVLTDDAAIRDLNRDWRSQDKATNVLSFPSATLPDGSSPSYGDIVLAYETIAREAEADGKPFGHHLAHLAVHGMLHLLGYDHENDDDAERMEGAERRILQRLGIGDPYP